TSVLWILAFILPLSCEPVGLRATFVTSSTPCKFSKYVVFFVTWSPGSEPSSFNISVTQCDGSVIFSPTLRVWH
ncbi:hypothetical protein B0H13DRAFT_2021362, partial [Mycena leptocephala]